MPVLKACLSLCGVRERESKVLLNSQALQSTVGMWRRVCVCLSRNGINHAPTTMGGATITSMHITTVYMKHTQLTLILQLTHLTNPEPSTPSDRPCISSQGLTQQHFLLFCFLQINTYGLDKREEVHELEFLSLFAFVARERERLRTTANLRKGGVFTRNDLEMAYAFRQQMTGPKQGDGNHSNQPRAPRLGVQQQMSPSRQSYDQRASYYIPKSQTEDGFANRLSSLSPPPQKMLAQSVRMMSPEHRGSFPLSGEAQPLFPSPPSNQSHMIQSPGYQQRRQSVMSGEYVPLGERLAARRAAGE